MKITNINKLFFVFGTLLIVILIALAYYFFIDNDNSINLNNQNTNYVSDIPGPTNVECNTSADCLDICKDDGCLVSSCVKSEGKVVGNCACFDLCTN